MNRNIVTGGVGPSDQAFATRRDLSTFMYPSPTSQAPTPTSELGRLTRDDDALTKAISLH